MDEQIAGVLANDLLATLASYPVPEVKVDQYAELIGGWANMERASEALHNVALNWSDPRSLPLPFHLQQAYDALREKYEAKALPLPDLTPAEIEANRRRIAALAQRYAMKDVEKLPEWKDPAVRPHPVD
jgi:hypothetical protein